MVIRNVENVKRATEQWIEQVVVGLNFCPFAKKPFIEKAIKIVIDNSTNDTSRINVLESELIFLDKNPSTATTLIVFENEFNDFEHYLDWAAFCEDQLEIWGYEGEYQLATFHPKYLFEGIAETDPSNYTNRSPFPMLHLIREDDVEWAQEKHPDIESVPNLNIEKTRILGIDKMKALLKACLVQ
ncbi:MAG: DUF1415 domain-containing protein [Bacteroidia bacterium]